jgi:predicted nucleotidyltransferase
MPVNCHELEALQGIVDAVNKRFRRVGKILLYGSKARGDVREESDIDLLFEVEKKLSRDDKTCIIYARRGLKKTVASQSRAGFRG